MLEKILFLLKDTPPEVSTAIVAALPIAELRVSIPLGLGIFKLSLPKVFLLSILGNLIPVVPLLLFLNPLSERLRHFRFWKNFFDRLFEQTKRKVTLIEKYEALGLALFVAVPLPGTGAWTGCIAASLFKIRFRYAFLSIAGGVLLAGLIVTGVTIVGKGVFYHLFLAR